MNILETKSEVLDNASMGNVTNPATAAMQSSFQLSINNAKGAFTADISSTIPYASGGKHLFSVVVHLRYENNQKELSYEQFGVLMSKAIEERNKLISVRNGENNPSLFMHLPDEALLTQLYMKHLAVEM